MAEIKKRTYIKIPLTIQDQISFLKQQGLIIPNLESASKILQTVSFYRLSGYTLPFKQPHHSLGPRKFKENITFELIWHIYQFDKELRLLVSDAIEAIEITFRTSLVNTMSLLYGSHWYLDRELFKNQRHYASFLKGVDQIVRDKAEVFIKHYYDQYHSPVYPPIWMLVECLSFGTCSKLFRNLKLVADKRNISDIFHQHPDCDRFLDVFLSLYKKFMCASCSPME